VRGGTETGGQARGGKGNNFQKNQPFFPHPPERTRMFHMLDVLFSPSHASGTSRKSIQLSHRQRAEAIPRPLVESLQVRRGVGTETV